MSLSLYWRPVGVGTELSTEIRLAFQKKFGTKEMSLSIEDSYIRGFLEGLEGGGIKEAGDVLTLLERYKEIDLYYEGES
jgi:hypothetical protein